MPAGPRRLPRLLFALLCVLPAACSRQPEAAVPALSQSAGNGAARDVFFCFWNVENLFDDVKDPKNSDDDEAWFGSDRGAVAQKIDRLVKALLMMNEGRGPDVLAMVEVEN